MIKLELSFKDRVLKKIETEKPEITIGRSPNTDIQIDNLTVSKQHARLIEQKDQYALEDLNSTNGTFLKLRGGVFVSKRESKNARKFKFA